jgi:hypothetical protein
MAAEFGCRCNGGMKRRGKKEEGRSCMNGSFDRAFFLGVRGEAERFGIMDQAAGRFSG